MFVHSNDTESCFVNDTESCFVNDTESCFVNDTESCFVNDTESCCVNDIGIIAVLQLNGCVDSFIMNCKNCFICEDFSPYD
jgi:hypothetical protein